MIESTEVWTSSVVDKRLAVSRSDLNVLPSSSLVCWDEPQSMRKLSEGENVAVGGGEEEEEDSCPLAETKLARLKVDVNRRRKGRDREKKGRGIGDDAPLICLPIVDVFWRGLIKEEAATMG